MQIFQFAIKVVRTVKIEGLADGVVNQVAVLFNKQIPSFLVPSDALG
jgi:hypothetical protein